MTRASALGRSTGAQFGSRLRTLRREAGLSQVALAGDRLHPSYVSLLEAGRRSPTPDVVAILAERLGVTPGELTGVVDRDLEGPLALAEASLGLGRPGEALEHLAPWSDDFSLERCLENPVLFRAAEAHATALERLGRLEEATAQLEVLCQAVERAPGRFAWLPVTVALVRCYRDAGDVSRAVDLGEAARARLGGLQSVALDGQAALVSTLAGAYAERGDLMRAALLLDDLLDQTETSGSLDDRARAYWNAAITKVERGEPHEALLLAEQASALFELGADLRSRAMVQVAKAWVLLAQRPPQASAARSVLRAALPALRQFDGSLALASAETELARCELLLGRAGVAQRHATSSLKRLGPDHRIERARALAALGASLIALDDAEAGLMSLDEAAELLTSAEAARQAAGVWRQLSEVFASRGDLDRALWAAERALDAVGCVTEPLIARVSEADAAPRRGARTLR